MNELSQITLNNCTIHGGTSNTVSIYDSNIYGGHISGSNIYLQEENIITIGEHSFTGKDLLELVNLKNVLKEIKPEMFI